MHRVALGSGINKPVRAGLALRQRTELVRELLFRIREIRADQ